MGVHAVLGDRLSALEIVEEREALHLLEDHALRVSRVPGGQLLLVEREGPVDAEVRQASVGGHHTVLSESVLRGEQPKRHDDRDQPAGRVIGMAATAGIAALIVDIFVL